MNAQDVCEPKEGACTDKMAMDVINLLQVIHIHQDESEALICSLRTFDFSLQSVNQSAVIPQSGQRIADRQGARLRLGASAQTDLRCEPERRDCANAEEQLH